MNLMTLLTITGTAGFFASRAFLPAFVTALALHYGGSIPFIKDVDLIQGAAAQAPTWFTSDACIIVLGILSILEACKEHVPEIEEAMAFANTHLKTALAALTTFGVLGTADAAFIQDAAQPAAQAGIGTLGIATLVGGITWFAASLREGLRELLRDADPDDSLKLQTIMAWAEECWVAFGVIALIVFPLLVAGTIACVFGMLALMRHLRMRRERQLARTCPSCSAQVNAAAPRCQACGTANPSPRTVDFLGVAKDAPAGDPGSHELLLLRKHRCPRCATHLPKGGARNARCPACGCEPWKDAALPSRYTADIARKVPSTLAICALLGLIPVLGMIAGVVLYRIRLTTPFSTWLSGGRRFVTRWSLRLLFVAMALLQLVPGIGAIAVPLMGGVSYLAYRRALSKHLAN